jgi:hypothetical protein
MPDKSEFFSWLKKCGLPYEPAGADDLVPDTELLIVDLRKTIDLSADLSAQAHVIRIGRIREDGMVYYRHHPDGKEECFVMARVLLSHETSVVLKSRKSAQVVHLRTAS